jgi:hypothetical protein
VLLKSALRSHDVPFKAKRGTIKHVNLRFPWRALDLEASEVEVSDIYILLELVPEEFRSVISVELWMTMDGDSRSNFPT